MSGKVNFFVDFDMLVAVIILLKVIDSISITSWATFSALRVILHRHLFSVWSLARDLRFSQRRQESTKHPYCSFIVYLIEHFYFFLILLFLVYDCSTVFRGIVSRVVAGWGLDGIRVRWGRLFGLAGLSGARASRS